MGSDPPRRRSGKSSSRSPSHSRGRRDVGHRPRREDRPASRSRSGRHSRRESQRTSVSPHQSHRTGQRDRRSSSRRRRSDGRSRSRSRSQRRSRSRGRYRNGRSQSRRGGDARSRRQPSQRRGRSRSASSKGRRPRPNDKLDRTARRRSESGSRKQRRPKPKTGRAPSRSGRSPSASSSIGRRDKKKDRDRSASASPKKATPGPPNKFVDPMAALEKASAAQVVARLHGVADTQSASALQEQYAGVSNGDDDDSDGQSQQNKVISVPPPRVISTECIRLPEIQRRALSHSPSSSEDSFELKKGAVMAKPVGCVGDDSEESEAEGKARDPRDQRTDDDHLGPLERMLLRRGEIVESYRIESTTLSNRRSF